MKICVYGCGAIGSLLAARLAADESGEADVSVIARGEHLAAINNNGLKLLPADGGDALQVQLNASDNPADLGEQDIVFLAMKSHTVPDIADSIAPLLGTDTAVVTAYNGIPWWYFYSLPSGYGKPELICVDPGKRLWKAIGPERAIGCVVYPAAVIEAPGVVRHVFGERFAIGEPDGSHGLRLAAIAQIMSSAGFDATMAVDIRADIWTKLVANAAFNPVSVITGKTLAGMIDDPAVCSLLEQIMEEVIGVAHALDVVVPMAPKHLLEATRRLGDHKTSMLQDTEAGRTLELGPIVGAVLELAAVCGAGVPNLQTVYDLAGARAVRPD